MDDAGWPLPPEPKPAPRPTLKDRTISALVPCLEDLIYTLARDYALAGAYDAVGQDFNGYVNVKLLNSGLSALSLGGFNFQREEPDALRITGTFIHQPSWSDPGRKMAIMVDVLAQEGGL